MRDSRGWWWVASLLLHVWHFGRCEEIHTDKCPGPDPDADADPVQARVRFSWVNGTRHCYSRCAYLERQLLLFDAVRKVDDMQGLHLAEGIGH